MISKKTIVNEILECFLAIKRKMSTEEHQSFHKKYLSPAQVQLLYLIRHHDGIGIKEIAEFLGVSSSAATQMVDNLVKENYIIREVSGEDRRALKLRVSDDCREKIARIRRHGAERMINVFDGLTDEELGQLRNICQKIRDNILEKTK